MNLKEFIKGKKLEIKEMYCNFEYQNYGYAVFITDFVKVKERTVCVIFDKNLEITFYDETIDWLSDDEDNRNIFVIRKNELYGVINEVGKEILPCIYNSISLTSHCDMEDTKSPICVSKDNKEALFDITGKQLTSFYDSICGLGINNLFIFCNSNTYGVVDDTGQELFRSVQYRLNFITSKILSYKDNMKYGLMDISGKILTKAKYDHIRKLNENSFLAISSFKTIEILNLAGLYNFKAEE